ELPLTVVDPVTGERARSHELVIRGAVGADRQRERRPRGRGMNPEERFPLDSPWGREAGTAADRLKEPNRVAVDFGLGSADAEGDPRDDQILHPEAKGRRPDEPVPLLAVVDNLAVVHLDPGRQVIGL